MRRQILLGLSVLALTGCANRVSYKPPVSAPLAAATDWNTPLPGGVNAKPADDKALAQWWEALNDPILTSLEQRALKGNLDLRKAEARIRQARALRNAAQTELKPTVNASGSANGGRSSGRTGFAQTSQSYSAGLDASWEPDFFGRIRQSIDAYNADIDTAQEDLRNTLVSLTAELALDYVDVRSYQAQLATTQANLKSQRDTYDLTVARYESGLATQLDAEQARLTVESTAASIPTLEAARQKAVNAIAGLLGERPGSIDSELAAAKPVPAVPSQITVGVPADLVRRRPDIRSAERQVAAQTARLGVTMANLNPAFTLSGALSLNSTTIQNLVTPAALASSLAGSVSQTVFNRRKLHEQVNAQDAVVDEYIAAYQSTVLTALQDVENALDAFGKEHARRKSLVQANEAAERAAAMSRELYSAGLKDFLTVLDAERSQLTLQNELVQCDAAIAADLVRLYKSLGGGWN